MYKLQVHKESTNQAKRTDMLNYLLSVPLSEDIWALTLASLADSRMALGGRKRYTRIDVRDNTKSVDTIAAVIGVSVSGALEQSMDTEVELKTETARF
jgi:hypothetical protein